MSKFNSYKRNIFLWSRHFKVRVLPAAYYGPCARCGKQGQHRHHKAHDYLFACILPMVYAERYLQFHPDDIDYLCKKCHLNCHKIYDKLIEELNSYLNKYKGTKYNLEIIKQLCEDYKLLFLARYLKWLNWGKKK